MVRGGKLCREDGQSTVEYALVVVAFLSILLALGVVWHSGRQGALLERADHIFPNIAAKPFVDAVDRAAESLKFVNAHRTDLKDASGKEILDSLFGRGKLYPIRLAAGRVLKASFCQKLEQRPLRPRDRGSDGAHHLVRLFHCGSGRHLMRRKRDHIQPVVLNITHIHALGRASSDDQELLIHKPLKKPSRFVMPAPDSVRDPYGLGYIVVPSEQLLAP